MTTKTKAKILLTVTMLMAFGFGMMLRKALYVPCGILACVWAAHLVYFLFGVKTIETKRARRRAPPENESHCQNGRWTLSGSVRFFDFSLSE